MKHYILIFLLSILPLYNIISQTNDTLQTNIKITKLTGYVVDSKNFNSVSNANCNLYKGKDTSLFLLTKSDSSGFFIFEKFPFGTYKLEIECAGYSIYSLNNIKFDENNYQKDLDTIKFNKSEVTTEEVLVEGDKPVFTFEGDKKVFNVTQSITSKGGTALDVLKKVPMVDVDINDNVTLRGSQNVKILIDDKPNRFINLKQLPADAILKVELITNPPAKYESEGVTGIINLVLKKNDAVGYNGYVYGSIGTQDKYYAGGNLNFKKDKINIYTGGYYGIYHYHSNSSYNIEYLTPVYSYMNESGTYTGVSKYPSVDGGLEYEVVKNHTIGIEGYYNNSKYNSPTHFLSQTFNGSNVLSSFYTQDGSYDGTWKSYTMSLYYNGKLNEKGKEISGDLTYSGNTSDYDNDELRRDYDSLSQPINNTPHHQIDNGVYKTNNLNLQIDYTHPFGKSNKIETGYKGTYRINDNNYQSDTLNYTLGGYFNNINVSNHFKLTETINSAYLIFGNKKKNFGYKLGLRVENTSAKSELLSGSQFFTKNYTDFFPTINLSQQIGQANQIQASYSRRITRPSIYRLNPFVQRSDPKFIYVGNPYLNPEFTDSYELSYMFFMKQFSITPTGFFRRTHDVISTYGYLTDSGVTVTTYKNATGSNAYGLDLIGNTRTPEWLNLSGTLSFYETVFDKDLITDYAAEQGFSWRANIRAYISISKIFKVELFYRYNGKKVNAQGTTMPSSGLDVGFSANFLNEKATVSIRASDVFAGMKWGQNVNGVGYNSSYQNIYDSRQCYLNISYRFGNTDEYYQKKKSTKTNENEGNDQVDEGKNK